MARWDGSSWKPMGAGLEGGYEHQVLCLTIHEGKLIAGGEVSRSGDTPVQGVALWNGSSWEALGEGIDGMVSDLVSYRGDLIAIWHWGQVGLRGGIARWDGTSWTRIAQSFQDSGLCGVPDGRLIVYRDQLYVGGIVNGVDATLSRWEGERWRAVETPNGSPACALEVYGDELFLGSHIWPGLMSWDGSSWDLLDVDDRPWRGGVSTLFVHDGKLAIGGWFRKRPDDVDVYGHWDQSWFGGLVLWDGRRWESRRLNRYGGVLGIGSLRGELFVGGAFTESQGAFLNHIARWDGTEWQPVGAGAGLDLSSGSGEPWVRAFVEYQGQLLAAGRFDLAGQIEAHGIARWSGSEWNPVGPGIDAPVNALAVYEGELYAAGSFYQVAGVPASGFAAWDGSRWRGLGLPLGPVSQLLVHDGVLVVAGTWTAGPVRSWDGASWKILSAETLWSATDLVEDEGRLVVAGAMGSGTSKRHVSRWNGDTWEQLGEPVPYVTDLQSTSAGLLAATEERGVLVWDGRSWSDLCATQPAIRRLALHEGVLYATGPSPEAPARDQLLFWDGGAWHALGSGLDGTVLTMQSHGGHLYLGGTFESAGGVLSSAIARWEGPPGPRIELAEPERPLGPGKPLSAYRRGSVLEVRFDVARDDTPVQLQIFDVRGRLVRSLLDEDRTAGRHLLRWDGRQLPSGVYFLRLRAQGSPVATSKLNWLR